MMTGKLLKSELKRVLRSRMTYIVLFIGCAISIIHVFHNIAPYIKSWNYMALHLKSDMQYPFHLFGEWICGNTYNLEGFLYFILLPLLVVMPHSLSFFSDKENGYVKQVYTRVGRKPYLAAKFGAVFIAGGLVAVIPLLLNLALCAALLPALHPQNLAGALINTSVLWYHIYELHPLIYELLFMVVDFVFAGLVASLPLFFSFLTEKRFTILLMPFIIHIFIYSVCMMTGFPKAVQYSPVYFTFAGIGCPSVWLFVIYGLAYFALGGVLFWVIGRKEDIY